MGAPEQLRRTGRISAAAAIAALMTAVIGGMFAPVRVSAATDAITEFPVSTGDALGGSGITAGPDGNVWFTESQANKVARITSSGKVSEFPLPSSSSGPTRIVTGRDGNLWVSEGSSYSGELLRVTRSGTVTVFRFPSGGRADALTAGRDGNIWFTEADGNKIGRITPSGVITEFAVPSGGSCGPGCGTSGPGELAAGSDGNIWFTEYFANKIGRITSAGTITEFSLPGSSGASGAVPYGITAGPDGNLWFTQFFGEQVGRITPTGTITEFVVPPGDNPQDITAGSDGTLWFTMYEGTCCINHVWQITTGGVISSYALPVSGTTTNGIATGPDGNVWFTEPSSNHIGRLQDTTPPAAYVLGIASGFTPATRKVALGNPVDWTLLGPTNAAVTDTSGLGLFNASTHPFVSSYAYDFFAAGTYPYADSHHPQHKAEIAVPMVVTPRDGTNQTTYTATWSTAAAPSGYVFDVQVAYCAVTPCTPAFSPWQAGTTARKAAFANGDPNWHGTGTYFFRSDLRRLSNGATSGFSPTTEIFV